MPPAAQVAHDREFLFALLNHLLWSTHAVSSRYLQVYAKPLRFDGLGVVSTCKATSGILVFGFGPLLCPDECRDDDDDDEDDEDDNSKNDGSLTLTRLMEKKSSDGPKFKLKVMSALLFGILATLRASLNVASAKFTQSYITTTINSFTPVVVSIGDALILKTKLPSSLWPCVIVSLFGCCIIGISRSPWMMALQESQDSDNNNNIFTQRDLIGCSLQFLSVCFSAAARLMMKGTEHILSRNETVQTNNFCSFLFPLLYTLLTNPSGWMAFLHMSLYSFVAWFSLAVLVYTVASTGQVSLVRSMGPGVYTSLSSMRVLSSAFLSAAFLGEPVTNWLEWIGLLITMVTVTVYTLVSMKSVETKGQFSDNDDLNWKEERICDQNFRESSEINPLIKPSP